MTETTHIPQKVQPYHSSLTDFCRFLDEYGQQEHSPCGIAALWESQAEALRISQEDVSVETIDLLLDTMFTTLQHLAEVQEQQRWKHRLGALVRRTHTSCPPSQALPGPQKT